MERTREYVPVEYKSLAKLKKVSQERVDQVLKLYNEGKSQNQIETELKMTRKTIRTILSNYQVTRTKSEQQSWFFHKESPLKEDGFDILTDECAYWLGFLYADGYITSGENKKYMGILLKAGDVGHLEKLKLFLDAPQTIRHNTTTLNGKEYGNVSMTIGSRRIYEKLQDWGFTSNKSHDANPPEILKNNRHFWRGVIDGDGYLGIVGAREENTIHLCGTVGMVEGFKNFVKNSGIQTEMQVTKAKDKELYIFQVKCMIAKSVMTLLYKDATVYLDRKYQTYLEILKSGEEVRESVGILEQIKNNETFHTHEKGPSMMLDLLTGTPGELIQSKPLKDFVYKVMPTSDVSDM